MLKKMVFVLGIGAFAFAGMVSGGVCASQSHFRT